MSAKPNLPDSYNPRNPQERWEQVSIAHLPKTKSGLDAIFVVVERLSKRVHFPPTALLYKKKHEDEVNKCDKSWICIFFLWNREEYMADALDHQKQWVLSSGTDVAAVLEQYAQTIPDSQKCLK